MQKEPTAKRPDRINEICRRHIGFCMAALRFLRADTVSKFRLLWQTSIVSAGLVFVFIGGGYAYGGVSSTYSLEPFQVLLQVFPHNLRAHGTIMVLLGIGSICASVSMKKDFTRRTWRIARIAILATLVYAMWCFIAFAGAVWINNHYTGTMWWYFYVAVMSGASASLTPPFNGERGGNVT